MYIFLPASLLYYIQFHHIIIFEIFHNLKGTKVRTVSWLALLSFQRGVAQLTASGNRNKPK